MFKRSLVRLLLFTLFLTSTTVYAANGDDCTPINGTPFEITAPGHYCLTKDLNPSLPAGRAIFIRSSDVYLDFRNFRLRNALSRKGNVAVGVYMNGRSNVKIANGKLVGFGTGVQIVGANTMGNEISNMHFDYIRRTAIHADGIGLNVKMNHFNNIGGAPNFSSAVAMDIRGTSPRIKHNYVRDVATSNGGAYGVRLIETTNPIVEDNTFDSVEGAKFGCGMSVDGTTDALLVKNYFQGMAFGIVFENDSTGVITQTLTSNVPTPLSGDGYVTVGVNY